MIYVSRIGIAFGGFILGVSLTLGPSAWAQIVDVVKEPLETVSVQKSFEVTKKISDIMASTTLDQVSAEQVYLSRQASEPGLKQILDRLDEIIKLLAQNARGGR